jgi:hypothetical protein
MNFIFWALYIGAWLVAAYFGQPAAPNTRWNLGWILPLVLIGILGYAVLRIPH